MASAAAPAAQLPNEFTPAAKRVFITSLVIQLIGGTMAIGLFPLLLMPVSTALGWSRTEIGAMAGISALSTAIGMPLLGALVDARGARPVLLIGLAATTCAFLLLATQSGNLIQGAATYSLMGFCSALSVVHVKAQSGWFNRHRGLVLGGLGVAIGLSFGMPPLLAKPILDQHGWRAVYAIFGLLPVVVGLPLAWAWFREAPVVRKVGPMVIGSTLLQALSSRSFWIIILFSGCSSFVFVGLQAHGVAFLQERGLDAQHAVEILSLAVAGTLVCQLISGWLLDRFRDPRIALVFVGAQLSGVSLLLFAHGTAGTVAGMLLLNAGSGGELSMLPYLLSRIFGVGQLARIYGAAALLAQLFGGASPVLLGAIHDRAGNYEPALPVFAVMLLVGCALVFAMPRFPVSVTPASPPPSA